MMSGDVFTGIENGIEWKAEYMGDIIVIHTKNTKNGEEKTVSYKCLHKPLFGYDIQDVKNAEKYLII